MFVNLYTFVVLWNFFDPTHMRSLIPKIYSQLPFRNDCPACSSHKNPNLKMMFFIKLLKLLNTWIQKILGLLLRPSRHAANTFVKLLQNVTNMLFFHTK